jgi:hypothetical protein
MLDTQAQYNGFKNRIINGAMVISQSAAGASVTINSTTTQFAVDRFQGRGESSDGVFTVQQSSTAPSGFVNSLVATVTTADSSIGSGQLYFIRQNIEGYNVADLNLGSASAQTFTLSFWVRSSVTGTFSGAIQNGSNARSFPFTYTISVANTFEYKTITITGDTSGTWLTTNGNGMRVNWCLGAGSTLLATANAWAAGEFYGATGQTNLIATNGATFYITGVQLEKGSTATSFDYRPYGTELQLAQRYYYNTMWIRDANSLTAPTNNTVELQGARHQFGDVTGYRGQLYSHPVLMRASPTLVVYNGNNGGATGQWYFYNFNGQSQNYSGGPAGYRDGIQFNAYTGVTVGTAGMACQVWAHWSASSEL